MAETIYNLLPAAEVQPDAKLKYTSIHSQKVKSQMLASKSPGKLFGPGSCKPDPKNFTKRGAGETIKSNHLATQSQKRSGSAVKPTVLAPSVQGRLPKETQQYVPRANERPTMAPKSNKNFLKTNVMDATKKTPSKSSIDKTHTKGEIPQYLSRRKEETAKAHDMANTLRQQQMEHNRTTTQLSAHDRDDLLAGLRANYQELYKNYLGLSVVTDTIPKRNVKNTMEAKLAELEADIAKLERHEVILIHQ